MLRHRLLTFAIAAGAVFLTQVAVSPQLDVTEGARAQAARALRPVPTCPGQPKRVCGEGAAGATLHVSKTSKLAGPLQLLASNTSGATLPKRASDMIAAKRLRFDGEGDVQVHVHGDASVETLLAVTNAGGTIDLVRDGTIQAWLPPAALNTLAEDAGIERIALPHYAVLSSGSVNTQGDAILNANDVRSTYGASGAGVRVGVLSDGMQGLSASQSSGDLPAVNMATCNEVAQSPTASGAGAEGTAMLEIVHDLAPGAELWFGHFGFGFSGTHLDFMDAVDCLADNVDIVIDDIGFFNSGPYDGTSVMSQNATDELNDVANRIRAYYTAAGNNALTHYRGAWSNSGYTIDDGVSTWYFQHFLPSATTTDAGFGLVCECVDSILLAPGGTFVADLSWNDPYGGSANDYDLFVLINGTPVAIGGEAQTGSQDPVEEVAYINATGSDQIVDIGIANYNGTAAARTFDLYYPLCDGCAPLPSGLPGQQLHNFNTRCRSVANNSDAGGGVLSFGAIDADDSGHNTIEPFSSCGPTADGRTKPEAAAIDGVAVTGHGGFPTTFFGTSATGPHAGGIAALLLECDPTLTRAALRDALLDTAVDIGATGVDNLSGHGRIDALAAAGGCASGGPTATPTPTETITPGGPTLTPQPPTSTPTVTNTGTVTRTATATRTPGGADPGDVDCNGTVTSIDSALILQLGAGMLPGLPCAFAADVNADGQINSLDALLVLQFIAGLLPSLPAGAGPLASQQIQIW